MSDVLDVAVLHVTNNHNNITAYERVFDEESVQRRLSWYAERSIQYPPGWKVEVIRVYKRKRKSGPAGNSSL